MRVQETAGYGLFPFLRACYLYWQAKWREGLLILAIATFVRCGGA